MPKQNIISKSSPRLKKWIESLTVQDLEVLLRHRTIILRTCWLFQGYKLNHGHGMITKYAIGYLVHRLSAHVYLKLPFGSNL